MSLDSSRAYALGYDPPPLGEELKMGRLGTDEEIAAAILFVASDEAAFMNGATIAIDGGMTI